VKVSAALPPGVSALFFEAAKDRRRLEARLVQELEQRGFAEVILPILDYFEPYEPLLSPAGRGELYRFIDRAGDQLALRADFTPMLARLLAPRIAAVDLPLRLFYSGDVVRYQEVRAGRELESYQIGAELLGLSGPAAEAEGLTSFLELLTLCGVEEATVVVGFAGALDSLLLAAAGDPEALIRLGLAVNRRERSAARAAHPALLEVVEKGVPADAAVLGPAAPILERLHTLLEGLRARFPGLRLVLDLAEFARFHVDEKARQAADQRSYYDGILFRAYGPQRALPLGGGGRYDQLFRQVGAESVSAAGFYLAVDRILALTEEGGAS